MHKLKKISVNIRDTEKITQEFLKNLIYADNFPGNKNTACVVGLFGELGVGKTTFVQYIAKHLGVKTKIKSPTFVIMKRYPVKTCGVGEFENLFHVDAYRLNSSAGGEKELLHLGWKEIIKNPKNLVFIEWPENVLKIMPGKYHKIFIKHTKEGYREFKIS